MRWEAAWLPAPLQGDAALALHAAAHPPLHVQEAPPAPNNTAVWLYRNPKATLAVRMFQASRLMPANGASCQLGLLGGAACSGQASTRALAAQCPGLASPRARLLHPPGASLSTACPPCAPQHRAREWRAVEELRALLEALAHAGHDNIEARCLLRWARAVLLAALLCPACTVDLGWTPRVRTFPVTVC